MAACLISLAYFLYADILYFFSKAYIIRKAITFLYDKAICRKVVLLQLYKLDTSPQHVFMKILNT